VLDKIRATLKSGEYKRQDQLIERLLEEGFSSTDIASALLHHLQGGESEPAPKAARQEVPSQSERFGSREATHNRFERPPVRHRDERPARRDPAPEPRRQESARPAATRVASPQQAAPRESEPRKSERSVAEGLENSPVEPSRHQNQAAVHERSNISRSGRLAPEGQTRLFMNVGAEMGVSEADVVETILGETGLPRQTIGAVDVRERHLFVKVASEHAHGIVAKLNRAQIKGRKTKVKVA